MIAHSSYLSNDIPTDPQMMRPPALLLGGPIRGADPIVGGAQPHLTTPTMEPTMDGPIKTSRNTWL